MKAINELYRQYSSHSYIRTVSDVHTTVGKCSPLEMGALTIRAQKNISVSRACPHFHYFKMYEGIPQILSTESTSAIYWVTTHPKLGITDLYQLYEGNRLSALLPLAYTANILLTMRHTSPMDTSGSSSLLNCSFFVFFEIHRHNSVRCTYSHTQ